MINYQSEVIVNRPVEQVYKLATDVTRLDDWTEMTGTHLSSGDKVKVGSQLETTVKMGPIKPTMIFEVTALEENRHFGIKKSQRAQWNGRPTILLSPRAHRQPA